MSTTTLPRRLNPRRTARLFGLRVTPDTKIMFFTVVGLMAVMLVWIFNIHV